MNSKITPEQYRKIVKKPSGLLYTRYINRPLAWQLTKRLKNFEPNHVSIFAFIFFIFTLLLVGKPDNLLLSTLLYFCLSLNYVLDSSDGQISRLMSKGSALGEWLDHSLDGLKMLILHAYTISIIMPGFNGGSILLFLPMISVLSLFIVGLLKDKIFQKDKSEINKAENAFSIRNIVLFPADYGIFIIIYITLFNLEIFTSLYIAYGVYITAILSIQLLMTYVTEQRKQSKFFK